MEINYCSNCSTKLEKRLMDEIERKACPNCSYVHWGNYSISVGALLVKDGKMLLVRRKHAPGKGKWTNPGGYIEQMEPVAMSVVREVFEETAITASVSDIVMIGDYPGRVHNVYIGFLMQYVDGVPTPDHTEVDAAGFFSWQEIEQMDVADMTKELAKIAFENVGGLSHNQRPKSELNGYIFYNA